MELILKTMWQSVNKLDPHQVGKEFINIRQVWNDHNSGIDSWDTISAINISAGSLVLKTPLPIASGGTNSGTALSNNRILISSSGKIIEASALTASGLMATDTNGIPTGTLNGTGVYALGQTNILINGGFEIWQRGVTFNSTVNAVYTVDRWKNSYGGSPTVNVTQEATNIHSGTYSMKVVISSATSASWAIVQAVENYLDYAGLTLSASAWVKTSMANIAISLFDGGITTGAVHPGDGNWHQLTVTRTISATPSSVAMFVAQTTTGVTGTLYIDDAMVVLGSQPVNYVPRPFAQELALCERYYEKSYAAATVPGTNTINDMEFAPACLFGTGTTGSTIKFRAAKRTIPTLTLYDRIGASGKISTITATTSIANGITPSAVVIAEKSAVIQQSTTATATTHQYNYTAEAEI